MGVDQQLTVEVTVLLRWASKFIARGVVADFGQLKHHDFGHNDKEVTRLASEGFMPEGWHRIQRLLGEES